MVKRLALIGRAWVGTPLEENQNGHWVEYEDYLSLRAALMEALDRWQQIEGETLYKGMAADRERIAEIRKQFLD